MPPLSHAALWFLSAVLVVAAFIDGWKLRVPNWLTYHLIAGGLVVSAIVGGVAGGLWSLAGAALGLALLLPLYAVGGMGAGDIKLLAGVGAWVGPWLLLDAFVWSVLVGAVLALLLVACSGEFRRHWLLLQTIAWEILAVRNPVKLAESARARKPKMLLLPYGIPIAIGSIGAFTWQRLLF